MRSVWCVLFCFVIVVTFSLSLNAATPGSATLAPITGATISWSGTIGGATTDETTCVDGVSCDPFTLNLSGTPTSWAGKFVVIKITWSLSTNDYDLYVHKGSESGAVVGSSTGGIPETSETVILSPKSLGTGSYTAHTVASTATPATTYKGTATVTTTPPPPPTSNATPPTYHNYQSPSNMGNDSGEPSIGSDWKTGNIMFQAVFDTMRVHFNTGVSPATAAWTLVSSPLTNITTLDPILFTDAKTGRTIVSQLSGTTSLSEFTDNDGASYTPSQGGGIASGVDHQTVGGGPFRSCTTAQTLANPTVCAVLATRGPLTSYSHAVYYASQDIGDAAMALSRDGGLTYEVAHPMYNITQCGGLHGHIKVSSSGIVFVPNKSCNGTQGLIVSMDNGLTFTVRQVTGSTSGSSDPSIGIGAKGRVFFGYVAANGHPMITFSDDQGLSWHSNQDVGFKFGIQNAVFPEVVAGDNDRASFFFLGTPAAGAGSGADSGSTPFNGVWHGYIATTYDGGKTWVTVDATPHDAVQLGVICTQGTLCPSGTRNLLDFNDLTVDWKGRVYAAYADGCITATCIAKGNSSTASHTRLDNDGAAKATIIRQSTGLGLFQKWDTTFPLRP